MTFRPVLAALFALFMAGAVLPGMARADVEIDVNQGEVRPLPIAIPAFTGASRGAEMAQVIAGNLDRSGLFAPIDGAAFPERNLDIGIQPDFAGWKAISAQALINGAITVEADGNAAGTTPPKYTMRRTPTSLQAWANAVAVRLSQTS